LLGENRAQEAFAIFNESALKHPDAWFVYTGLARVYGAQGKFEDAAMEMKTAMRAAPDDQKSYLDGLVRQLEAKQDNNE
jgi:predicted Zn-dependent protease